VAKIKVQKYTWFWNVDLQNCIKWCYYGILIHLKEADKEYENAVQKFAIKLDVSMNL